MAAQQYLLVVNLLPTSVVEAVRSLRKNPQFANLGIACISRTPTKHKTLNTGDVPLLVLPCKFETDTEIEQALQPVNGKLRGVVCRADKNVQYLRKATPFLPEDILHASVESLDASTHKQLMRQAFRRHAPEITPEFVHVADASLKSIEHVEATIDYPVIVKPVNLASSLLVQSCHSREALRQALEATFAHIQSVYAHEDRAEAPRVIVEEYLEGDFYSIDAYVSSAGQVWCCPPVRYIPAKQRGIDDFFIYKRYTSAILAAHEITRANETAAKAVASVGLTASSAHIELVRTANGWKVIELGPRPGRFRDTLYGRAYNIDHSLNDIKVRLGLEPEIPTKIQKYCCAYSIYPEHEGMLVRLRGLDEIAKWPEVSNIRVLASPGQMCRFARNGGHALAECMITASTQKEFEQLMTKTERLIGADIDEA